MLKLNKITKKFGDKVVIDALTLTLPDNCNVALCGPSGAGKSTLLSIIAGIETFDSGIVEPAISSLTVSMSFQDPCLIPGLTAAENVNIVMGDKPETLPAARALLEELGITDTEKYPDRLSGGMKVRVGIARALAVKSRIYLFDEPFAALDEENRYRTAEVIQRHTTGALTVMVIHDKDFARRIADTLIVFKDTILNGNFIVEGVSANRL